VPACGKRDSDHLRASSVQAQMSYKIKLDIFEGPFDLLVYLIESARMSIYDIQVAEITDQYMQYLGKMQSLDINVATEFMVLAAALIEIKSKMLLPRMKAEGEGAAVEDPRAELVERILEYKRFKRAAELLELCEEQALRIFEKPKEDLSIFTKEPDEHLNIDLDQFVKAFHLFLLRKQKIEEIHANYDRVERQKITLENRIEHIKSLFRIKSARRLKFQDLLENTYSRYEIVLTFVSLLEMIRQKTIAVKQNVNFGEITLRLIEKNGADEAEESGDGSDAGIAHLS